MEKTYECKFCGEHFKNGAIQNHIRWKHSNIGIGNRKKSEKWIESVHNRKGKKQDQHKEERDCPFCKKHWETTLAGFSTHKKYCKENPNRENFVSHKHSEETKELLRSKQLQNSRRRIMRHTQEYNGVLYDSSWEIEFAKRLEFLHIDFTRPEVPLTYELNGISHHYFPDFYIEKIGKFVEIKNPYLYENDEKVKVLKETRKDIIWLTSLESIKSFSL